MTGKYFHFAQKCLKNACKIVKNIFLLKKLQKNKNFY